MQMVYIYSFHGVCSVARVAVQSHVTNPCVGQETPCIPLNEGTLVVCRGTAAVVACVGLSAP
jgi:hypothetical protein